MKNQPTPRQTVQVPLPPHTLTTDLIGDYSLPDYQPEIKRLLRIEVSVLPPAQPAGLGATELEGAVDYYVLYMGHDNALYCAPLTADYRLPLPDDSRGTVGEPLLCLCDMEAEPPTGRVTAPRRLSIRCRLTARVALYGEAPLESLPSEESDEATEALMGEATVGRVYASTGETLALEDDLILPPGREWRVVCVEGAVMITGAEAVEDAVNLRGDATVKLTLCPAETAEEFAADTPPVPTEETLTVLRRKLPFAETVPMEGVTPACTATAKGFCTELSVEMEEGHVHIDLGVMAEVRAQQSEVIPYVKDRFSTRRGGEASYTTYPTERAGRALVGNFTLSDSLPLEDTGIDPSSRILDVTAAATPEALTVDTERGRGILTGTCRAHLLLLRDGEYAAADMTLPFRYELDLPTDAESTSPDTAFDGSVAVITCRARMDGERVGLDAELAVSLRTHTPAPMTALSELTLDDTPLDTSTRRRGEYVICFPAPADTLWSVAKRYHAPLAALTAANNLPSAAPDAKESLEGVGYLIV